MTLDDVLRADPAPDAMIDLGSLRQDPAGATLQLRASAAFRELVVFTPVHRDAFCLEPYTCTTDAINLQARGVDAGWATLAPGAGWLGVVEMEFSPP